MPEIIASLLGSGGLGFLLGRLVYRRIDPMRIATKLLLKSARAYRRGHAGEANILAEAAERIISQIQPTKELQ